MADDVEECRGAAVRGMICLPKYGGIGREAGDEGAGCRAFCRFGEPHGADGPAKPEAMILLACRSYDRPGGRGAVRGKGLNNN